MPIHNGDDKVEPYDSYGTREPTSTKRSNKRGRGSKLYTKNKSEAQSKAKSNIARMMKGKDKKQDVKKNIMTRRH